MYVRTRAVCCCAASAGGWAAGAVCCSSKGVKLALTVALLSNASCWNPPSLFSQLICREGVSRIAPIDVHSCSADFALHTIVFAAKHVAVCPAAVLLRRFLICSVPAHTQHKHARLNVVRHTRHPGLA